MTCRFRGAKLNVGVSRENRSSTPPLLPIISLVAHPQGQEPGGSKMDREHFEVQANGHIHWFLNGHDMGEAEYGPLTSASQAWLVDQRQRGIIHYPETLTHKPGTKVTVHLDIPGWRGSCYGWVLEDLGSELIVEADDNTFTVVQVAKTSVTLGWAH